MAPKELNGLVIKLAAKLDQIREADITLDAQVVLKECGHLCNEILSLLQPEPRSENISAVVDPSTIKTLLVIDDDEDTLRLLRYLLERKGGFRVECRQSAKEALENLDQIRPELILVDLMMPQMSGFEFLRRLRTEEKWKKVKIMVGSSRSYDKDRLSALGAGANDFIAKPYNLDELVLRLRNLVSQQG